MAPGDDATAATLGDLILNVQALPVAWPSACWWFC